MSQDDSGVHSDSTSTPPQRKRSAPVTAKELKVTWNFCPKKEGSLVEEDDVEKERRGSKEETKGRRGSSHSWSSLGRRRTSKDVGFARRRSRDERRGSDSSIGQDRSLYNTLLFHHLCSTTLHHMAFICRNLFVHWSKTL